MQERKRKLAKALSLAVGAAGIAVIFGWTFNITFLTSIHRGRVTMKLDTAILFVISGTGLLCL